MSTLRGALSHAQTNGNLDQSARLGTPAERGNLSRANARTESIISELARSSTAAE